MIGRFPQSETANHPVPITAPEHLWNADATTKADKPVICPEPILAKHAIRSDLLSAAVISNRLLISDRLKQVLEKYGKDGFQYFPTNVIDGGKKYPYYVLQAYRFRLDYVDFPRSEIILEGIGSKQLESLNIQSAEEFSGKAAATRLPERLRIIRPALVPDIDDDFFALHPVTAGIGFYVSGKVKQEIETMGLTGISFEACR